MDTIALSSSSSSTSSSRSAGGEWTGNLYFYPDMDDVRKDIQEYVVTNDELRSFGQEQTLTKENDRLEKLFGEDEEIELVRVYSNPLRSAQLTKVTFHHAFVLFKIKSKQTTDRETWWSIEKNTKSVTIQTSKNGRQIIRGCYRRERRPVGAGPATSQTTRDRDSPAKNNVTVYKLIQHIHDGNYLNDIYNLKNSNCQHFADRIFEFIAIPPADRFRRKLIRSVFTVIIACPVLFVFYTYYNRLFV